MYESKDVNVSHPGHYQSKKGLEVIDVIEAFTEGLEGIEATDTGNVIKYICRWKKKNGLQDLEKALWYLQHLVDHVGNRPDPKADNESVELKCCVCGYYIHFPKSEEKEAIAAMEKHVREVHEKEILSKVARVAEADLRKFYKKENA